MENECYKNYSFIPAELTVGVGESVMVRLFVMW